MPGQDGITHAATPNEPRAHREPGRVRWSRVAHHRRCRRQKPAAGRRLSGGTSQAAHCGPGRLRVGSHLSHLPLHAWIDELPSSGYGRQFCSAGEAVVWFSSTSSRNYSPTMFMPGSQPIIKQP